MLDDVLSELYDISIYQEQEWNSILEKQYDVHEGDLRSNLELLLGLKKGEKAVGDNRFKGVDWTTDRLIDELENMSFDYLIKPDKVRKQIIAIINNLNQQEQDTQAEQAGWLNEAETLKVIGRKMGASNKRDRSSNFRIRWLGGQKNEKADYVLEFFTYNTEERDGYLFSTESKPDQIFFENKSNLERFRIVSDAKALLGERVDAFYQQLFQAKIDAEQQIYHDMEGDIKIDNPYIYTITLNKDNIKYTIMSLIVYDKLVDKTPIFTTSRGDKIYFKLCSEVISSMIRDHRLLTSSSKLKGLPEEYNLNIQNNMGFYKKEILKEAGDSILKQINKYEIWYGK